MRDKAEVEACERMLDAELTQLFADRAAVDLAPGRAFGWRRLAVTAAALAIVGALWFERSAGPSAPFAQEPVDWQAALPAAVTAASLDELAALPADVQNLRCALPSPADLLRLGRLRQLRRLELVAEPPSANAFFGAPRPTEPPGPQPWSDPAPSDLAPLLALPELRELQWPRVMRVTSLHVETVAPSPQLRAIVLPEGTQLDADLASALAKIARLDTLRVEFAAVPVAFVAAIARLRLRRLDFLACAGIDQDTLAPLRATPTLTALGLTFQLGSVITDAAGVRHTKGPISPATMDAIAALPALRDLDLEECDLTDEVLQRLPAGLTRLSLGSRHVDFAVATALARLPNLRALTVGAGSDREAAERMAKALAAWRLQRFEYRGIVTPALVSAIAAQPELTELRLHWFARVDLAPLAEAKALRTLRLCVTNTGASTAPDREAVAAMLGQVRTIEIALPE